MKKVTYIILVLIQTSALVFTQNVKVKSIHEIAVGLKNSAYPVLNFEGNKLLFSTDGYNGLHVYDFVAEKSQKISESKGSGYNPVFSNDGKRVFFRSVSYSKNRSYQSVESFDMRDSTYRQMLSPRREMKQLQAYNNGFIVLANGLFIKSTFGKVTSSLPLYATVNGNKILIFDNNKVSEIRPFNNPDINYIWISVSPDGKKILFTATGKGTFICDLKGSILAQFGFLNAPVWYNDFFIAGMYDKDDGHVVVSSEIVLLSADGKNKYQISPKGEIAMYPTTSAFKEKIAWHTTNGKIKIAELEVRQDFY